MLGDVSTTLSVKALSDNTTSTSGIEKKGFANNCTKNAGEHEDWEIINPSNLHPEDFGPTSSDMSVLDTKSNDTKVLEHLDTRMAPIEPSNAA